MLEYWTHRGKRVATGGSTIRGNQGWENDKFYQDLRQRLGRALRQVTPYWMRDQIDDLEQVCLMRILSVMRRDETRRSFSASYLWRVAYTAMIDEIRKVRSRQEVQSSDDEDSPEPMAPPKDEPDRPRREISEAVRKCLQELIESRRDAVALYLLGYKVPEIARRMQWNRKKASNLAYRGLEDLRACLESLGVTP